MDYNWDFLIIFGVIILGVFIYAGGKKIKRTKSSKAMDVLDERYAKGEITKEEYEEIKQTIGSKK
ncbi:SHOCT domain-containing protein [Sinomicrobium oceani]|uniref:SHOCT domain-containing protein n=1 Tax=Sinomicrobium oceani TaxID=1150368 RepID=UPI00227D0BE2|nr:SHOCT domain-containing protein [Sinomicrobium oceani]